MNSVPFVFWLSNFVLEKILKFPVSYNTLDHKNEFTEKRKIKVEG